MFITACKENDNDTIFEMEESGDFIEATRIEEVQRTEDKLHDFYKSYLQKTDENFEKAAHQNSLEDFKQSFLELQGELSASMKEPEDLEYTICQELECPVCLTEMIPPMKIWTCKSGHSICQLCKRNPNIGNRCPTCRQIIIGRATTLEKIVAAMYKRMTGKEAPVDRTEEVVVEESSSSFEDSHPGSFIEIPFLPEILFGPSSVPSPRTREGALERELSRLFSNVSLITANRHIHIE